MRKTKSQTIVKISAIGLVVFSLGFSVYSFASAWVEPTTTPTGGNIAAPINTGTDPQTKQGTLSVYGLYLNGTLSPSTGNSPNAGYSHYGIYEEPGSWAYPYPDLMIEYHTGIKYIAYYGYGGHRFYTGYQADAGPNTLAFSVGEGDHNVRVYGDLYVGATGNWLSTLFNGVLHLDTWQGNHYSASDGREYATIFYDTNDSGYYVDPNGNSQLSAVYANNWFRAQGQTGLYFQDYGGGWYMQDSTWIRAYNSKNIYTPGEMQATTVKGNSQVCIGGDCRNAWPSANLGNWYFSGTDLVSNGWGHIYTTSGNLHLDSYSGEMYLNYYYDNWVNIGNRDTGYLRIGDSSLYDNNDWLQIYSGANNRIYTNSYLRVDNNLEIQGNIYCASCGGWLSTLFNGVLRLDTWQGNHYSGSDGTEYATNFRDTNDGGYYLDPNGSSRLNQLYYVDSAYVVDLRPQYMYDWNDTNYYMDFNNTSQLNYLVTNNSYAYGWMQAANFLDANDNNYYLDPNGTSRLNYTVNNNVYAYGWMQAANFLDANDNGYRVDPNGDSQLSAVYANNWFRAQGQTGLYFQDYGGGWYMQDSTWIRAYNSKNIYTPGEMQATTVRGNSQVCIGGDCRTSWPSSAAEADTLQTVTNRGWSTSQPLYSSNYIYSGNYMQAPIFYDANDSNYYVDPNSVSMLNDVRVNILYDRQDTGYYVDPNGTSRLNYPVSNNAYEYGEDNADTIRARTQLCIGSDCRTSWPSQNYSYTYYCYSGSYGTPVCSDAGGARGFCPVGFHQLAALGNWGACTGTPDVFLSPGGSCGNPHYQFIFGQAYVCQKD